jgi:hypothetical protein
MYLEYYILATSNESVAILNLHFIEVTQSYFGVIAM